MPAYFFAPEMLEVYPDVKVILNTRKDLDAWTKSMEKTIVAVNESWVFYIASWFEAQTWWAYHYGHRFFMSLFYRGQYGDATMGIMKCGKWVYRGMLLNDDSP